MSLTALSTAFLWSLTACAPEVGSEAWCTDMKAKPKADWTANPTSDFAKSCIFKYSQIQA
ncbi:MAG TPA: DUF3012 domain-containing protein [Cycloclasticus sp.]|nr:DUF3012 domain-containing protein [Cycloclasticus sp.]